MKRALGLHWTVEDGTFKFSIVKLDNSETKQVVLATIASLYDPLRFATQITLVFKALLKRLWQSKLDWDEQLPPNELRKWKELKEACLRLHKLRYLVVIQVAFNLLHCLQTTDLLKKYNFIALLMQLQLVMEPCRTYV